MIIERNGVVRVAHAALIAAIALVGITCSERGVVAPQLTLPTDFVISNARPGTAGISATRVRSSVSVADQRIVYVSLPPLTVPNGLSVEIRDRTTASSILRVPLVHGGFDPVPIAASDGDELALTVVPAAGATIAKNLKVPARRPPTIVRSDPRKGRTDIALNVSITVVFSEPVDPTTIGSNSVYLLKEGSRVSGHVQFADNSYTVKFVPDKPLAAQSSYELVVTPSIRDLDGDVIEGSYSAAFVTGSLAESPCPGYADPADCPPFPTGGDHIISGVVTVRTDQGTQPLANAIVFGWVQRSTNGYSRGGIQTDAEGRYVMDLLPANATIVLDTYAPGYDQPCAAVVETVTPATTVNIELRAQDSPNFDAAAIRPYLSGVVYEETPTGQEPIAGAHVFFSMLFEINAASTTTDSEGRYRMCSLSMLSPPQLVWATKSGYQVSEQTVFILPDSTHQDIELKR